MALPVHMEYGICDGDSVRRLHMTIKGNPVPAVSVEQ